MANIADCAFAVAKDELDKLDGAVAKTDNKDGYESLFKWHIKKGEEEHEVLHYHLSFWGGIGESETTAWYKVDGKQMTEGEYNEKYSPKQGYIMTDALRERLIDKTFSNGYAIDWQKMDAYWYESDANVQEYDDHVTVYFGGRWSFPDEIENYLNASGIKWQGAGCEDGCDWQCDDLGNYDYKLRIERERDDCDGEDYSYHYVEDKS